MIFVCPTCGEKYTLPLFDEMRDKNVSCQCGNEVEELELKGRDITFPSF